jgi:hypothetical protein
MNRRELLTGAAAVLGAGQAHAFGLGKEGARGGFGSLGGLGGARNPLASYVGQVATRTYLPDNFNSTNKQMRGRSAHFARDTIVNPTLRFPNFYVDGFGAGATYAELGSGSASTITAAIEYPAGVQTQITFAGSASGSITNLSYLDGTCPITIANGDWFGVRFYITNTSGIVFSLGLGGTSNVPGNFQFGDVLDTAVSGLTDNTMSGAYTATSGTSRYSPIIIAAPTTLPAVLILPDSKGYGENDTGDGAGDIGEVQRWISPYFANACWGIRGRDNGQFVANSTLQASMSSFFTHMINQHVVNDFIHGKSAATSATDTTALGNLFPTLKKFLVTCLPVATSTDNYATLVNQTTAAYNASRVTENTRRRTIPAPYIGCFDSASALESSLDSGLDTPLLDLFQQALGGVHPVRHGYLRVAEANRASAASLINRNGSPISFASKVFLNGTDQAQDNTSQTTYDWSARNFLIGTADANRLVVVGITARFGTTGATLNSVTIGGAAATKINEVINVTGGAETITSVWYVAVAAGNTATVSATFSTAMLRAGCDVWSVVGSASLPTVSTSATGQTSTNSIGPALTVPARGGSILWTSIVNAVLPSLATANWVACPPPVTVGSTLHYASGSNFQTGAKTFTTTWSAGTVATGVAVSFAP